MSDITLIQGDSLIKLKELPENSVDSIVTDPPYELGFMGKKWDITGIANNVELWKECLRVLKPGGHLLAFSGTRTYHRMASAIEDAGFEVRDMIEWVYGSGFPKSLNIGKSVNQLETKEWLKISKAFDNIDQKSIMDVWKKNALFATIKLSKNLIEVGINTPKSGFAHETVVLYFNQLNERLNAIFVELQSCGLNLISDTNEIIVQENAGQTTIPSKDLVRYAARLSENQNHKSWSIFTAQCDVKEWLNENTEVNHKVDEALKILRGNKKYSNEEITSVLCVVIQNALKHTILNQSKTFQNLDTTQKTECVSAINVIITEYTAECLISNTVAILKSKAVDKLQGNEREVKKHHVQSQKNPDIHAGGQIHITMPNNWEITKGTSEWEGWGTALKPAHEPICMARKPLSEKTVAENCLKWGTGGINIDESRVGFNKDNENFGKEVNDYGEKAGGQWQQGKQIRSVPPEQGRFPANLIHDNSEEVRECFPDTKSGGGNKIPKKDDIMFGACRNNIRDEKFINTEPDSGNASRFFKSIKKDLQYSPKHAILKLCENNISVNNAENNLKTTSQIELVASIFSALKSATPNLDLLNQNLNALFVEKSADSIEIDFVAKCVAIKEIPEELVSQQDYTVFRDFMEDYKKCSQIQNPVSVEKWGNIDITQIMISLLKLCGYVHLVIGENINSENREEQKCEYKSLVYIPKASKSERNKGCEELEEKAVTEWSSGGFGNENTTATFPKLKNNHPTVKPIALMEYLIKIVTPKGGTVLDPFMGSGSTGVAAKQNCYSFIGIEMEEDYIKIAQARIDSV